MQFRAEKLKIDILQVNFLKIIKKRSLITSCFPYLLKYSNPDVFCNSEIKFNNLLNYSLKMVQIFLLLDITPEKKKK